MRSLLAPPRPLLSAGTGPVRWRTVAGFAAFALPFAFVLVMFRVCDVYHERFFAAGSGRTYLAYNAARVLYIAYLAWLVSFVGGGAGARPCVRFASGVGLPGRPCRGA